MQHIRGWLAKLPFSDPLKRQQAGQLQFVILLTVFGSILAVLSSFTTKASIDALFIQIGVGFLVLLSLAALMTLRRGHFNWAVLLSALSFIGVCIVNIIPTGLEGVRALLIVFVIPIIMVGMLSSLRSLIIMTLLSMFVMIMMAVLEVIAPNLVGYSNETYDPFLTVIIFCIVIGAIAVLIYSFSRALHQTLAISQSRQAELEQLQTSLESTIAQRTAELQTALHDVQYREQQLTTTIAELTATKSIARELSVPIIPVLPGVLAVPLIGNLDHERISVLTENALRKVEQSRATHIIFDITGIEIIDTFAAQAMIKTIQAARLLGTEAIIVGIRPEIAETVVALGIDLSTVQTYASLQNVIRSFVRAN